jgi:hypothetical protein
MLDPGERREREAMDKWEVGEEGLVECHRERYWLKQERPRLVVKEK